MVHALALGAASSSARSVRTAQHVGYVVVKRSPTVEEYLELIRAVGWGDSINPAAVASALSSSLFAVVALEADRGIGIGRIIGDGGMYYYIQDVVVLPERQGRGVGTAIMGELFQYLNDHAPEKAFIGLMSATGKAEFYERYGFQRREPGAPGMFQRKYGLLSTPRFSE